MIVLDVPRLSVSSERSSLGVLTFLPLGYRLRILRGLLEDFGMEERAFSRRVHGPVLGLPEENEYLLRYLASRLDGHGKGGQALGTHYLVVRYGSAGSGPTGLRWQRIGPYAIVEYEPVVDYRSWSYAVVPAGAPGRIPEQGWSRLDLPASSVGVVLRQGEAFLLKGLLRRSTDGRVSRLAVNIIAEGPMEVDEARRGETRLSPVARHTGQSPSLYWTNETVFELEDGLQAGDLPILIALAGHSRVLLVDIYEARGPEGPVADEPRPVIP